MMGINPAEIMWQYLTFNWSWKDLDRKDIVKGILLYPLKAPVVALVLGFMFFLMFVVGGFFSIISAVFNLFKGDRK